MKSRSSSLYAQALVLGWLGVMCLTVGSLYADSNGIAASSVSSSTEGQIQPDTWTGRRLGESPIRPRVVSFGETIVEESHERTFEFSSPSNILIAVTNVRSEASYLKVTLLEETEPYLHVVHVTTIPPVPLGVVTGKVVLFTDNQDYPEVRISIGIKGESDLMVIPKFFRQSYRKGEPVLPSPLIIVRSRSGQKFTINDIQTPDPAITIQSRPLLSGGYRLELIGMDSIEDLIGKSVVIQTDHPTRKNIEIPFVKREVRATNGQR